MLKTIIYSISGVNIIPTTFLLLNILFWILKNISLGFSAFLNSDIFNFDSDGDGVIDNNLVNKLININGDIPFNIFGTIWTLFWWILSMLTYGLSISTLSVKAVVLLFINLFISLYLTRVATQPLIPIFKELTENNNFNPINKEGILTVNLGKNRLGTLLINLEKGRTLLINVTSNEDLLKGDRCVIKEKIEGKEVYLVEKI